MRRAAWLAACVVFSAAGAISAAAPPVRSKPDADQLRLAEAGVSVKPASLVRFLEQRCGSDADLGRIASLVEQLGESEFREREDATKRLKALGAIALPQLIAACSHKDLEVVHRARSCVATITKGTRTDLTSAAVRLVAKRNLEGAAAILLRFLPYAAEPEVEEVWFALDALAKAQSRLDPAFAKALDDAVAVRRAAAAYVLGRRGTVVQQRLARVRLQDKDQHVRLRAAQGLLARHDGSGIPYLIDLLATPEIELAWQAEELLHWVAGGDGPDARVGAGSSAVRQQCRQAWLAWWRARGHQADFAFARRLHGRPGLLLVVEHTEAGSTRGTIWVCGCDGCARWRLTDLAEVTDVHWLAGGRLLMTEKRERRWRDRQKTHELPAPRNYGLESLSGVTERDLEGKILWKHETEKHSMDYCERRLDGRTALASGLAVVVIGLNGKLESSHNTKDWTVDFKNGLYAPRPTPAGHYLAFGEAEGDRWHLALVDPANRRSVWAIPIGDPKSERTLFTGRWRSRVQPLPNGNYLVKGWSSRSIREIDPAGRVVWQPPGQSNSLDAFRLPTGNTVLAGYGRIDEVAPAGNVVWEAFAQVSRIQLVRPCLNLVRLGFDAPYPKDFDVDASLAYQLAGLRSRDLRRRHQCVIRLGNMGPKVEETVPALLGAVPGSDESVTGQVERALWAICTEKSLPLLLRATKDACPEVRVAACSTLGKFRDKGKEVVPVLLRCLRDDHAPVRREAALRLQHFPAQADQIVPALIKALDDKDRSIKGGSVSTSAAHSLTAFPKHGKVIVPALIRMAKSEVLWHRRCAISQLAKFPAFAAEIEPVLRAAASDADPVVRKRVEDSLKALRR